MDENKEESWFQRIKGSRGYNILVAFIKSAAVGLLFAVICFAYDVYHDSEQDKQLEKSLEKMEDIERTVTAQLASIEQNLSTRYLGIFPEYISQIGELFRDIDHKDTIVIFEDVLYYGIKSRPKEFFGLNKDLFEHALNKGSITVAFYDFDETESVLVAADIFHKMIIESRIDSKYHSTINEKRAEEIRRIREVHENVNRDALRVYDSVLCETYFAATRNDSLAKFEKDINAYLKKDLVDVGRDDTTRAGRMAHQMCVEIDSVKQYYLGGEKTIEEITFFDYELMYRGMSRVIAKSYESLGIRLVPLREYLTMSCWMVQKGDQKGVETVLAFPSKYSTDEIGFYSQDEAFSRYIGTMLEGVQGNVH